MVTLNSVNISFDRLTRGINSVGGWREIPLFCQTIQRRVSRNLRFQPWMISSGSTALRISVIKNCKNQESYGHAQSFV